MSDELFQLRQLIALAQFGNITKAAKSLGISHSALSQTVKRYELRYEVPLFEPGIKRINVTSVGERLIAAATTAVRSLDQATREITLLRGVGKLVLGIDPMLDRALIARAVHRLCIAQPEVALAVLQVSWRSSSALLIAHMVDIFVGLEPDIHDGAITHVAVPLSVPKVVCRAGHPLDGVPSTTWAALARHRLICGDLTDAVWERMRNLEHDGTRRLNDVRHAILVCDDMSLLLDLVRNSDAIGLICGQIPSGPEHASLCIVPSPWETTFRAMPGVISVHSARLADAPLRELVRNLLDELTH